MDRARSKWDPAYRDNGPIFPRAITTLASFLIAPTPTAYSRPWLRRLRRRVLRERLAPNNRPVRWTFSTTPYLSLALYPFSGPSRTPLMREFTRSRAIGRAQGFLRWPSFQSLGTLRPSCELASV